jgi:hypothetical protein
VIVVTGASAVSGGVLGAVFNFCDGSLAFAVLGRSIDLLSMTMGGTGGICSSENPTALEALRDDMLDLLLRSSPLPLPNKPPNPPPVLAPLPGDLSTSLSGLVLGLVARLEGPTFNTSLSLPTGEFVPLMLPSFSELLEGEGSRGLETEVARGSNLGAWSRLGNDDVWYIGRYNRESNGSRELQSRSGIRCEAFKVVGFRRWKREVPRRV